MKTEGSASLNSPKPTDDISNVKIEDTDIVQEGLNETAVPARGICISSESSQEDTVLADEYMSVLSSLNQFSKFFPTLIS